HLSLSLRCLTLRFWFVPPSSNSLSSTPSHRFLLSLSMKPFCLRSSLPSGLEKPYHCMGSSNHFRSTPMVDLKGKGIIYEEDDEPIQLFDEDDAHTIREYRMSLIGKVLNPKKQNVEKLIQYMPTQWKMQDRITANDLVHDDYPWIIPFWVEISGIPLHLWTVKNLKNIGRKLGHVDTIELEAGRLLINVDTRKPPVFKKKVQSPVGEEVTITIKYDLLFKHCTPCGLLTHEESYCSKKVEMMKAQTLSENNTIRQPIMDESKDRMSSRPYHYGAASTAHREPKYKSSIAHEGYNRDRRYDNRERNGCRSKDSCVMGKTNAARYGRRFAPYEHSATSQWRENQSRSGGLHTFDRSLKLNEGASKSSPAQKHVRDHDVVVASRTENVRHNSGKKLASAIVTPSCIAPDDTNVTVRGHEIARSMTFSPMEKAMQQSPKGDDLVIDALKDMDIAGIGEKDQQDMTMDCDEDDLLGAELETLEDVECAPESSSRSAARMDRPRARSSRSRSRSRVPLGLQSTKARLLSKGSPMKMKQSSSRCSSYERTEHNKNRPSESKKSKA
ncbi:hypothetical protein HID58_070568, partial [Brassica napus]